MTDTPSPAPAPDGADPSMEDILASIRRILNEEEPPVAPASSAAEQDDVLVLDRSMMVAPGTEEGGEADRSDALEPAVTTASEPDVFGEPIAPPLDLAPPAPAVETVVPTAPATDPFDLPAPTPDLMAPETAAAAASSVGSLVRSLAAGRSTQVYTGGPTLEDMVRAELRPLLKDWLDTYLPPMVERLVRTEIERVVGRAVP